jgi:3-(3-hydroxy-phenyl)propionate hydroxylase
MMDVDVIIAGAGPVGTIAAYALAQAGLQVMIAEAGSTCAEDLRASTFHPPTLEMLQKLGLLDDLAAQGLAAPVYQYRVRSTGDMVAFDLSELADITPFPYRLQAEQFKLARLLVARLEAMPNVEIAFQHRVAHFSQDADGVSVAFETATAIEHRRGRYLIAADGANSIVRKWLNVQFEGFTYPEKFLCLSTAYPIEQHFPGLAYVNYVTDEKEWLVLLRVPTLWRVLLPAPESEADEALRSDANKAEVFERLVGDPDVVTAHRTIYRVHQRVAERYDHGRVLLAGDAAHLNNPLGGLGMNSGIHDAMNLTDRLVRILLEGAEASAELSQYDRQRRSVMHNFVQAQTIANKRMLELGGAAARNAQYEEVRAISRDDDKRRDYLMRQSMFTSISDAAAIH